MLKTVKMNTYIAKGSLKIKKLASQNVHSKNKNELGMLGNSAPGAVFTTLSSFLTWKKG